MSSDIVLDEGIRGPQRSARAATALRPALVLDLEMSQPISPVAARGADGSTYRDVWMLVRVFTEPIGLLALSFTSDWLSVEAIAGQVDARCGDLIRARVRESGGDVGSVRAGLGTTTIERPTFLREHPRWLRDGPEITVVVCTRNRPVDLARALDSLTGQIYRRFRILVVDNAPSDRATAELVARLDARTGPIDYEVEPRPGLSWARNRALASVRTPVVAWLDDDEVADRHWLLEIAKGFGENPGAAAVSGLVVPAELETESQLLFEQYGGHTKGRGFTAAVFDGAAQEGQSPLYPLPAFGAGANMAFDVATLRAVGGFDNALGAGTATLGGEDTLVFSQILLRGGRVVYRPSAITRHYHRRDYESLARQMAGYGSGLTAYYASLIRHDWKLLLPLARLAPRAGRDMFGAKGGARSGVPESFPPELLKLKTRGMLRGPVLYVRACRRARRLAGGSR